MRKARYFRGEIGILLATRCASEGKVSGRFALAYESGYHLRYGLRWFTLPDHFTWLLPQAGELNCETVQLD